MKKGWQIVYEWDIEEVSFQEKNAGDIYEHNFAFTLSELKIDGDPEFDSLSGIFGRLVLVKRTVNEKGLIDDSDHFYLTKDGKLPTCMDEHSDEYHQVRGIKECLTIPTRYVKEFEKNKEWASKLGNPETFIKDSITGFWKTVIGTRKENVNK